MSQQYGHPRPQYQPQSRLGRSPAGPPMPPQGGWGPGPGQQRPRKEPKTQWIVMGGAVLAVVLIATGAVLSGHRWQEGHRAAPVAG